jgi:ribosomal protein L37AE/L43A
VSSTTSPQVSRSLGAPQCILCHRQTAVRQLAAPRGEGMTYWTCDDCLASWAARPATKSTAADRSPRKLA